VLGRQARPTRTGYRLRICVHSLRRRSCTARTVRTRSCSPCRPTLAWFFTRAARVAPSFAPDRVTAACSARTERYPALPCSRARTRSPASAAPRVRSHRSRLARACSRRRPTVPSHAGPLSSWSS